MKSNFKNKKSKIMERMNYKANFSDRPLKSSCNKCENDAAPNSSWDQRWPFRLTYNMEEISKE